MSDRMQTRYSYTLSARPGRDFAPGFRPQLSPAQMLRMGVFARHRAQILASYKKLGRRRPRTAAQKRKHRPRQRQALLQWAYRPYV